MTTIAALPTVPNRSMDEDTFTPTMDAFLAALPTWATQANTLATELNNAIGAVTAGTAVAIAAVFDSSTTMGDPASNGRYRLNNGTPASATELAIDDKDSSGNSIIGLLDSMLASTSTVKGYIRLYKDGSNYQLFSIGAVTFNSDGTHRRFTVTHLATVGTIANTNAVTIYMTRTGDAGSTSGNLANQSITGIKSASFNGVVAPSPNNSSGAMAIDWTLGSCFKATELTGAATFTMTAPAGPAHLTLLLPSDGSSVSAGITLSPTPKWMGAAFTATTANKNCIINLFYDGTNYFASAINEA